MAIVRFVARKVGMASKSDVEFLKADMVGCHFEEIWSKLPAMRFSSGQGEGGNG